MLSANKAFVSVYVCGMGRLEASVTRMHTTLQQYVDIIA